MKNTLDETIDILGSSKTEAWASVQYYTEENVSIPTLDGVIEAKKWIEENEK